MKQLLAIRKALKSKKPTFTRHDAHKKKRVGEGWRRPKGRQNKMRLHRKGYAKIRSTGYSSPRAVKGLSSQGLEQKRVFRLADFDTLDNKKDGVIIASAIGNKTRLSLIEYAEKNNFTILNFDAKEMRKAIDEKIAAKKVKQKEISKRRESKKKAKEKAAKEHKEKQDKEAEKESAKDATKESTDKVLEEKEKIQEKKEHDKVLTKKD